ncbi:flagellar protein FlaG [Paenibacillus gallinarum]|uniref:Flagellar protein FlaG n=1 Tax=Paenibacillus gallinarum TaxID=2762232 RepID=A0ABR8T077_9BACL|nr:flagellar protein FlaG [Paenibacillus gallinarum]MBD7968938.1 flagellar protein FlaG [Paenibacillus gallinarum]
MNLQSSFLSTNAVFSKKIDIDHQVGSVISNKDTILISTARNASDIIRLEKSGMLISIGEERMILAIEKAAKILAGPTTTLEVSIHDKTHEIMVKVINKEDGSLIREIPPEKTLDLVAQMMEIAGILVDEKV